MGRRMSALRPAIRFGRRRGHNAVSTLRRDHEPFVAYLAICNADPATAAHLQWQEKRRCSEALSQEALSDLADDRRESIAEDQRHYGAERKQARGLKSLSCGLNRPVEGHRSSRRRMRDYSRLQRRLGERLWRHPEPRIATVRPNEELHIKYGRKCHTSQ